MRNQTRQHFNKYLAQQASLNGVINATAQFEIEPTIEQKITERIQESSDFLKRINMVSVRELKGQKLALGSNSTIASTTDTDKNDVQISTVGDMSGQMYECETIDFATGISYSKLDAWAKFPDFQIRLRNATFEQQKRDLIIIGFNGTHRADTSDRTTNPLLQDVSAGWLQEAREHAPERCLTGLTLGIGGSYNNPDALVMSMVNNLIVEHHQDDTGLVAICGRNILNDKYLGMVNDNSLPSEKLATDIIIASKQIGGLPAIRVPFFPADAVMVTTLDNLAIYVQEGSRRRQIKDNAARKRIEDYQSANYDFVVEDFEKLALVEDISYVSDESTDEVTDEEDV